MDKYEYKLKLEQIKNLIEAKEYEAAAQIADSINWKKVKSVATLCMVGDLFEKTKRLEESKELFLMAYDRSPVGRNIIYRLSQVAIKLRSLEEAQEYYEEFLEIAPHDNMKYVLKYEIAKAKGASLEEMISILEEFKEREYTEEWAFELAYLYHRNGQIDKCVDICDELILWFGEGRYVEKALELKLMYQPLNKLQEDKYRRFRQKREGIVEVSPYEELSSGEIVHETVKIPSIMSDTGRFNTMNLQAELAKSMEQIMSATEQETVNDTMDNIKRMVEDADQMIQKGWSGQIPQESQNLWPPQEVDQPAWENYMPETDLPGWPGEMPGTEASGWSGNMPGAGQFGWPGDTSGTDSSGWLGDMPGTGQPNWADQASEAEQTGWEVPNEQKGQQNWSDIGMQTRKTQVYDPKQLAWPDRIPEERRRAWMGQNTQETWGDSEDFTQASMENMSEQPLEERDLDPALDIDFRGILTEEPESPENLPVADQAGTKRQITGKMSIEDILAEWERTKEAAQTALQEAERQKLENAKVKALREAEKLVERLMAEVHLEAGMVGQPGDVTKEPLDGFKEEDVRVQPKAASEVPIEENIQIQPEAFVEENPKAPQKTAAEESVRVQPEAALEVPVEENIQVQSEVQAKEDFPRPLKAAEQQETEKEDSPQEPPEAAILKKQKELERNILKRQQMVQQVLEREVREEQMLQQEVTVDPSFDEEPPITQLNEEQKRIFTYFTCISGMEQQLCQALEGVRQRKKNHQTSRAGNLVIIGGKRSGKTTLATDFVKAYQKLEGHTGGKVGKISAETLNKKDVNVLCKAVEGGYLIIEKAGGLSRESVDKLSLLMEQDTKGMMVILEDEKAGIQKTLARNPEFTRKFTEKISVPIFTSDELVTFAKAYAKEHDCEIEDMGILALYNSISSIQKLDEATTLTEVKEIMDEAISRASRGGLKKLFGGKRSSENGRVLIKEKDFKEY